MALIGDEDSRPGLIGYEERNKPLYSEVEEAIDCPDATTNADGNTACTRAKQIAWTVISILPISMFFALFAIFGGFSRAA